MDNEKSSSESLILNENIEQKIYLIRGQRVMLDSDLAEVYQVQTKVLNQAVKRNLHRFPDDFMFQLTEDEFAQLRNWSQFVTSSDKHRGASYRPFAFTEHGAVMLASVLNSPTAIEASINVVRAFVRLRTILTEHKELATKIEEIEKTISAHGGKINQAFVHLKEIFHRLPKPERTDFKPMKKIGFIDEVKNDRVAIRKI